MLPLKDAVIRSDALGSGLYGASRGERTHKGIDYVCEKGQEVYSPCDGVVTRWGWCYTPKKGEEDWRYIQVTDKEGSRHRIFYVDPLAVVHKVVKEGEIIAHCKDISERYDARMTPHVHYEVISDGGEYINPETL